MENTKKIGVLLIVLAVAVLIFGVWLRGYNDKIAETQVNETGTCYLPDGTCLHSTSDFILYVVIGIVIVLGIAGIYLFLRKKEQPKVVFRKEKKEEPVEAPKTLTPETKGIFDIIAQSNGAILQGELVTKSGMDKVKVSRILNKLEMHGLIERRRHGMSNLVILKKK